MTRIHRSCCVALALLGATGCGSSEPAGPEEQNPPEFPAIVSNPVSAAFQGSAPAAAVDPALAYISIPRGTLLDAERVRVENLETGASLQTNLVLGGFDPLPLAAQADDVIRIAALDRGGAEVATGVFKVPRRRGPIIVRTDPPPQKRDVPLNATLRIIFSEPIDLASLDGTSLTLTGGGTQVAGTVRLLPGSPSTVEFIPANDLLAETSYELQVTRAIRDTEGDALETELRVTFTTLPPPLPGPTAQLAFTSNRDGTDQIYVAKSDGSGVRRITDGTNPAFSPDGRRIAFNRGGDIYVMNADGSNQRFVANGAYPAWSPDGTQLVFNTGVGLQTGGIYAVQSDGTGLRQLLATFELPDGGYGDPWLGLPNWSPDGRSIVFVRARYGIPWTYYLIDADGSNLRRVELPHTVGDTRPQWSPEGTRLLAPMYAGGPWAISSFDPNGANLSHHVTGNYLGDPDWSPDGARIVFTQFTGPPDPEFPVGTRLRIFVMSLSEGVPGQLIPEAVSPVRENYWDSQIVWSRGKTP